MHFMYIEDVDGQLVEVINLCSDFCARLYAERCNIPYRGWNGCQEIEFSEPCATCNNMIQGVHL